MNRLFSPLTLIALAALAACSDRATEPTSTLTVSQGALTYDGVGTAKYRLTLKNASGAVVWTQEVSSLPGNDGAFVEVGACDASDPANPHTLELVLLELRDDAGNLLDSPDDYLNPTITNGVETPVIVTPITCVANDDVLVPVSITVLLDANQGFLDFETFIDDIYCSAKVDCRDEFFLQNGVALPSVIFGFACTAGNGDDTHFYLSDLTLTCTDGTNTISAVIDLSETPAADAPVLGWQQNFQQEYSSAEFDKCFQTAVIGLDPAAIAGMTCTLSADGTVSDSPLPLDANGHAILPATGTYPYVHFEVEVFDGTDMCDNNGLDATGSAVTTHAILNGVGGNTNPMEPHRECGGETTPPTTAQCDTGPFNAQVVDDGKGGYVVSATNPGGGPALSFNGQLPPGYTLSDTCCTPACCLPAP